MERSQRTNQQGNRSRSPTPTPPSPTRTPTPPLPSIKGLVRSTAQVGCAPLGLIVGGYQNAGYLPVRLRKPNKKEKDRGAGKGSWLTRTLRRSRSPEAFGNKSEPNVSPAPTRTLVLAATVEATSATAAGTATAAASGSAPAPVVSRLPRRQQTPLSIPEWEREAEEQAVPPAPRNSLASLAVSRISTDERRPEEILVAAANWGTTLQVLEGAIPFVDAPEDWERDAARVFGPAAIAKLMGSRRG